MSEGHLPYIIYILTLLVPCAVAPKSKKAAFFIAAVTMLFAGVRYNVGWDYEHYYRWISNPSGWEFERLEYFMKELMLVAHNMQFIQFFFIATSIITTVLVVLGVNKRSPLPSLSLLCYICLPLFFFQSLTIIRQLLAVSLIFFAFTYYYESKRPWLCLILILMSYGIHSSSVLAALVVFFTYRATLTKNLQILLIIASFFISQLAFEIGTMVALLPLGLAGKVTHYILENSYSGFGLAIYIMFAIGVINLVKYDQLVALNPANKIYIQIYSVGITIYNAFLPFGIAGARLSIYMLIFIILIIPYYVVLFKKTNKVMVYNSLIAIMVLLFFTNIYINTRAYESGSIHKDPLIPYKTYFENS